MRESEPNRAWEQLSLLVGMVRSPWQTVLDLPVRNIDAIPVMLGFVLSLPKMWQRVGRTGALSEETALQVAAVVVCALVYVPVKAWFWVGFSRASVAVGLW